MDVYQPSNIINVNQADKLVNLKYFASKLDRDKMAQESYLSVHPLLS